MTCAHVQSKLTRYLERMCEKQEVARMARHIEGCPSCAQELRDLQRVRSLVRSRQPASVDPVILTEIQTSIHEQTTHAHLMPRTRGPRVRRLHYALSVAAVLLITAGSLAWKHMAEPAAPAARSLQPTDDMYFILQEHALQTDESVFNNGALGSVMITKSRKK